MEAPILLVDDDPGLLEAVRRRLSDAGPVRVAGCAREGLEVCERWGPFAVVISDYDMPGGDGLGFLRELARREPATYRILLSGSRDPDIPRRALEAGVARFLAKPPMAAELRGAVREGQEAFVRRVEQRRFVEGLEFSRDALEALCRSLEARLAAQIQRARALEDLLTDAVVGGALEPLARRAVDETARVLGAEVSLRLGAVRAARPEASRVEGGVGVGVVGGGEGAVELWIGRAEEALGPQDRRFLQGVAALLTLVQRHSDRRDGSPPSP